MAVYDEGEIQEGLSIASSIYLMVHDGGNSTSILKQLGRKQLGKYRDSAPNHARTKPNPGLVTIKPPALCFLRGDVNGFRYVPLCAGELIDGPLQGNPLSFSSWWEQDVFKASNGVTLSRKNLVFRLRSQEGGAHLDEARRDEALHWLAIDPVPAIRSNSSGIQLQLTGTSPGPGTPIANAHFATIRQIAWELDQYVTEHCADIL